MLGPGILHSSFGSYEHPRRKQKPQSHGGAVVLQVRITCEIQGSALLSHFLSPPLQRKTALETGRAKATYGNTYLLARVFPVNTTESLTAGLKNRIRGPGETLHCIYVPGTSLCTAQARQLTSLRIGVPLPASNTHSREAFARHPAQHAIDGSGCTAPSAGAASHGSSARHARALRVD